MYQKYYIHESATTSFNCNIGEFTTVGKNSSVGKDTNIGHHVHISDNVKIGDGCVIGNMVTICENVEVGNNTMIDSGVVFTEKLNRRAFEEIVPCRTCVGENVQIKSKVVIEAGCRIPDNTVIECGMVIMSAEPEEV